MIRFKDPNTVLIANGVGRIDNSNITQEKYEVLCKINPKHAEFFEEAPDNIAEKKTSKTKSISNE
jgi:hypothetical protein